MEGVKRRPLKLPQLQLKNKKTNLLWLVLEKLVDDLGISERGFMPIHSKEEQSLRLQLSSAINNRDMVSFLELCTHFEPQSMLEIFDKRHDVEYFSAYYLVGAVLKKFPHSLEGVNPKDAAMEKFYAAERTCAMYNNLNYRAVERLDSSHPDYYGIIDELKADISQLLGPIDLTRVLIDARHGPGAVFEATGMRKRGEVTAFYKNAILPYTCTADALDLVKQSIESDARWMGALDDWYRNRHSIPMTAPLNTNSFWNEVLKIVPGNRVTTVPKNYKTDRTIAIEPSMNVYLQLGVDGIIRRRLRSRWNYDLDDQELNQRLALKGSVTNELATLDLASASDTISLKCVEMLIPDNWFYFLYALRSHCFVLGEDSIPYAKFSSMGNGYTFALESLIFGAVVRYCFKQQYGRYPRNEETAVYGDDLIIPSNLAPRVVDLLNLLGFSVNREKSFTTGPFRESCGKDYFCGVPIRPIFLKRKIETVMDLFYVHNALWIYQGQLPFPFTVNLNETLKFIRMRIPIAFRQITGPPSEDLEGYLFSKSPTFIENKWGGRYHRVIVATPITRSVWKYKNYFFVKLMARLRGVKESRYSNHTAVSGNCFIATIRGGVTYTLAFRQFIW